MKAVMDFSTNKAVTDALFMNDVLVAPIVSLASNDVKRSRVASRRKRV